MDIRKLIKNFEYAFAKPETHFNENLDAYKKLLKASQAEIQALLHELQTTSGGLSPLEVRKRLKHYGYNVLTSEKSPAWYKQLFASFNNPFNILLIILAVVSYFTGDTRATMVMILMVLLSVFMRFLQEYRSSKAAEKLKALVRVKCTVRRPKNPHDHDALQDVLLKGLVPGDIVLLNAGDVIPADVRVIDSKDLFISQAVLTGESVPVEKHADNTPSDPKHSAHQATAHDRFSIPNICYMGTNVVSGTATVVVVSTSKETYFGSLALEVATAEVETSFDKGINNVSFLLVRFMLVMAPTVFLINGLTKGNWSEAFLFAIAIAVGLTPEMLPMVVTTNLAKGAIEMSKKKTVVKHLQAIQVFGAMDILCTDKTGTLTQDKIVLKYYQDANGNESPKVLEFCFVNSFYQSGLQNLLDKAILEHHEFTEKTKHSYKKIDEIPFDFERRKMSVVVEKLHDGHILICKGAAEEIMNACNSVEIDGKRLPLSHSVKAKVKKLEKEFNEEGFRVIGLAYKNVPEKKTHYSKNDESDLIFLGFLALLDPPKETAAPAIKALNDYGIRIKILTGDNEIVTRKICKDVGLDVDTILLGDDIDGLSDTELRHMAEKVSVFAKLAPMQKARIVQLLRSNNHTVGFLGDGINDAPPLKQADVGISVDTAADIAKESADVILLEKSLLVLKDGVIEGRITFGNTMKYLKATSASNFGNVLSILGSSAFLPFLPMRPIHMLIQNLLYDFSQAAIPTDSVDNDYLKVPRKWDTAGISRFMFFIGPISSIFDYTTFALMWFVFHANNPAQASLFQSGWFVEGLLTQTIIVHMIRTQKVPFLNSTASLPLTIMTILIICIGTALPFTPVGAAVGLRPLPLTYFAYLIWTVLAYCLLMQGAKMLYMKRFNTWI
jgi:Mg2+-importing ATPase